MDQYSDSYDYYDIYESEEYEYNQTIESDSLEKENIVENYWNPDVLKLLIEKTMISKSLLAEILNVSSNTINRLLKGTIPSLTLLIRMADFFAVPTDLFLGKYSEEQVDTFLENYSERFSDIRRKAYENYLISDKAGHGKVISDFKLPYPYNILYEINNHEIIKWVAEEKHIKALENAIDSLSDEEKNYIDLYYKQNLSLHIISEKNDISKHKVVIIIDKAIRKLRQPTVKKMIFNGMLYSGKDYYSILETCIYDGLLREQILCRIQYMTDKEKKLKEINKLLLDIISNNGLSININNLENTETEGKTDIFNQTDRINLIRLQEVCSDLTTEIKELKKMNSSILGDSIDLEKSIDEMEFSIKTYNCLKQSGINSLKELADTTQNERLLIKGMTKRSLKEIDNTMTAIGFITDDKGMYLRYKAIDKDEKPNNN